MPTTFWARFDNGTANNPALNLTGAPAVEITFTPSGPSGDLLLEYNGGGIDPDTQVTIDGTSYDFTFEYSGEMPTLNRDGAQQVPDQFEGAVTYLITVHDYPTAGETTRLMFMPEENATQVEMDDFGNGAIDVQNLDTTTDGAVCFATGTLILTPDGEVPVEDLKAGDVVETLDHGSQPVVWVAASEHAWPGSPENEIPVLISAGALGAGVPKRDLVVSPQHKVLVNNSETAEGQTDPGVLAPAKGLTAFPGIRSMKGKRAVTYHHVMLERHQVLVSEGAPTESFYPGPMALRMLTRDRRNEVQSLIAPPAKGQPAGYGPAIRRTMSVAEAREWALGVRKPRDPEGAIQSPVEDDRNFG